MLKWLPRRWRRNLGVEREHGPIIVQGRQLGIATGGPKEGFAGKYHVRYFYESGEFSDEYDLIIEKSGDGYKASWITNGKLSAVGVGMVVENRLAVGWRRVDD